MTAPTLTHPTASATSVHTVRGLLSAAAGDLATHLERNGPLPATPAADLICTVEASGLTGRGGAGFPTWRKLVAVASGRRPVVVANAAEGEPASRKDAVLLARAPHLVLDGLQLAARAVGSTDAYVYVKAGDGERRIRVALAERSEQDRRRGRDRGPTWDPVRIRVVVAPSSFLAGEESAVVAAIEGRPALPRTKLRLVTESGVRGRPTLVQNAETLAHLALLARHGADWFRRCGSVGEPGTFLATLSGAVAVPGVVEAPYGVALDALLAAAGGPAEPLSAVLVGGYHGAWVPASALAQAGVSRSGLAPFGATPGAGVVIALPATSCGLARTARYVEYLAGQSARQCGPCLFGLPELARDLRRLADVSAGAPDRVVAQRVSTTAGLVDGRGACKHPDGTVRLVRSALTVFADDVRAHLAGRCLAEEAATARAASGAGGAA